MRTLLFLWFVGTMFFVGCGMRPVKKASELLFDVPYMTKTCVVNNLTVGIKPLSEPEIHELFCQASDTTARYHVLYLRFLNRSGKPYFVNMPQLPIPLKKELKESFSPNSSLISLPLAIGAIPLSIGLSMIAPAPEFILLLSAGIIGGARFALDQISGNEGYSKLFKRVIAVDKDKGMPGITVQPYETRHHLLFLKKTLLAPDAISFSIGCQGEVTKELSVPFEQLTTF